MNSKIRQKKNCMPTEVLVKVDYILAECVSKLDKEIQKDYINGGERVGRVANLVYYIQKHMHDLSDRTHVNSVAEQDNNPNFQ